MTFHRLQDAPLDPADFVCRHSRWRAAFAVVASSAFAGLTLYFFRHETFILYADVVIMGLVVLMFLGIFARALRASNWLLRANDRRVLIQFRSYLNARPTDDDLTVVSIDLGEIAWLAPVKARSTMPSIGDSGTNTTERTTCLDVGLKSPDGPQLRQRLRDEQNSPALKKRLRANDIPVRVVADDRLRIEWRSSTTHVIPALHALKQLHLRLRRRARLQHQPDQHHHRLEGRDDQQQRPFHADVPIQVLRAQVMQQGRVTQNEVPGQNDRAEKHRIEEAGHVLRGQPPQAEDQQEQVEYRHHENGQDDPDRQAVNR